MVFCNNLFEILIFKQKKSHNPYFNRWFSAIEVMSDVQKYSRCHNPYFNRWFSAISTDEELQKSIKERHNPYFNRWFSAIVEVEKYIVMIILSQSLF